jgi:REP element-mobilizing transposase RayT
MMLAVSWRGRFVSSRAGSRQKVFLEQQDYETFLNTIGEIHDRWRVDVFAYCLMGNHHHIYLRTISNRRPRASISSLDPSGSTC